MKTRITTEDYSKYFDYGTSGRESLMAFACGEISAKVLLGELSYRPSKKFFKSWLNYYGVNKTRDKIFGIFSRRTDGGLPRFS